VRASMGIVAGGKTAQEASDSECGSRHSRLEPMAVRL
jgi:hypothetical protein